MFLNGRFVRLQRIDQFSENYKLLKNMQIYTKVLNCTNINFHSALNGKNIYMYEFL